MIRKISSLLKRIPVAYMALVALVFGLLDLSVFGLTEQDEAFYASIARAMVRTGDLFCPRFAGSPWFQKPPLLYWLMYGPMKLLGPSEFGARLPSLLALCITAGMLAYWGNKRLGSGIGTRAALILALSPLAMGLSRTCFMDMTLTCCIAVAMISMWETSLNPMWCIAWGAATGLGVLAKGPLAMVLIGLQMFASIPLLRKNGLKFKWVALAFLCALAVLLPWYLGIYLQYGREFFSTFIIHENLMRFAGGDTAHAIHQPILYLIFYALIIWIGFFPFSTFVPKALTGDQTPESDYVRRWTIVVFVVLTASITKLPSYILPLFPALALLTARSFTIEKPARTSALAWTALIVGGVVLTILTSALALAAHNPLPALLGVGMLCTGIFLARRRSSACDECRSSVYPVLGIAAVLIGLHFSLVAYDSIVLAPIRHLTQQVPHGDKLIAYDFRLEPRSIDFYTDGHADWTHEPSAAENVLHSGGYCLAVKDRRQPENAVLIGSDGPPEWTKKVLAKFRLKPESLTYNLYVGADGKKSRAE
jgi:4-amino-4-deoxy-L-arabinose transferase-like glycosyltransferase